MSTQTASPQTASPEPVIYGDEKDHLKALLTCGHYSRDIFDRSSTWDFTHEEQECPQGCTPVFFTQEVQDRANAPEPIPLNPAKFTVKRTPAGYRVYDGIPAVTPTGTEIHKGTKAECEAFVAGARLVAR